MRNYKCLQRDKWVESTYHICPIRDEDKELIRVWRNEQIDILRQSNVISKDSQENYFKNVVTQLFEVENPQQLLFSFFENNEFIGYGGLVHIDWKSKNAEISFLVETERNNNFQVFQKDMTAFLKLIFTIAFEELQFHKLHTSLYDIRNDYVSVINELGFQMEGRLKEHVLVKDKLHDLIIYSYFNTNYLQ